MRPVLPNRAVLWMLTAFLGLSMAAGEVRAEANPGSLRGVVRDRATLAPIVGANVIIVGSRQGSATDLEGVYTIANLKPGSYQLRASAVGYEPRMVSEVVVLPGRAQTVDFPLQPTIVSTQEVTYSTYFTPSIQSDQPTSTRTMRNEEVRRAPGAAEDVQRMIQALPGVAGANDQNNEIVVRGGNPYENLTVMDGIEVENINHFGYQSGTGGPISALNAEFLQDVTFASGGFSAKYGDRLSSVLVLDLREGDRSRYGGAADLNMAGAGGNLEGPLNNGQGSFLVAGHLSFLDLIHGAVGLTAIPHYWNTQGKVVYDLSPRHQLTMNLLYANDNIDIEADNPSSYSPGTEGVDFASNKLIGGVRLRSLWGPGYTDLIFARSTMHYTADLFKMTGPAGALVRERTLRSYSTEINDQAHLQWTARAFGRDEWSAGVSLKPIRLDHELWALGDTTAFVDGALGGMPNGQPDTLVSGETDQNERATSLKYAAYVQYTWHPVNRLYTTAGLRYDGFDYSNKHVVGPRLSLRYDFLPRWTLSLSGGVYYQAQPLYIYTSDAAGGNRHLPYSRAVQYVAGLNFVPRPSTLMSVETYFKDYSDLVMSQQSIVRETTGNYAYRSDVYVPDRAKQAWGVELFAQQKLATHWYGTLSYSYGNAEASDPAFGTYAASYDFRHTATLVLGYTTSFIHRKGYRAFLRKPWGWWANVLPINGDEVTFSTRYRYISGRPYIHQVWYDEGGLGLQPYYEGHWENIGVNNVRYPPYTRWDIRLDSKSYVGNKAIIFYLEIQNLLNRANVADYIYGDGGKVDTVYQYRFFFVGGFRFEF